MKDEELQKAVYYICELEQNLTLQKGLLEYHKQVCDASYATLFRPVARGGVGGVPIHPPLELMIFITSTI